MVYVLDDTGSLRGRKNELFNAFRRISADCAAKSDARIAAFKHVAPTYCLRINSLSPRDARHVTKLFELREPKDVQERDVKSHMKFRGCLEQLFPAIDKAMEEILRLCPEGVDTNRNPWCQRKVIMVLGDGDPGAVPQQYYTQPYPNGKLPDKLLKEVKDAGIAVHTYCISQACLYPLRQCGGFPDPRFVDLRRGHCVSSGPEIRIANFAYEIMEQIAAATGGVYHGRIW